MNYDDFYIWQDKEVRFDVSKAQIALREGEKVYDTIANVEDTKGNNGDIGTLIFSNIRLIWYCVENIKINLSLGYDCIISHEIRSFSSKIAGDVKAIAIKCKFNNNRFEFVFNAVSDNSPQLFNQFDIIYKAYDTSRLYRDIKMKGFLTLEKNFITLPEEKILNKFSNVASVSNDILITGTFYMTNVRLVWFSSSMDNFNMSVPWIQIRGFKIREMNKSGKVLCIETGKGTSGNNFYLKFNENIEGIIKDLEMNYKVYVENPILSVDLSNNNKVVENVISSSKNLVNNLNKNNSTTINVNNNTQNETNLSYFNKLLNSKEEVEIIETNFFNEQSNMLYYMTSNQEKKNAITDIVFSNELGLAIEKLPDNTSLENLWKIIVK